MPGYLLNGVKKHITNAPIADLILVLGRIPELGTRDITLFLIERGQSGLETGEAEVMFGNRTSPTGPLHFRDLALPAENVIGLPGNGLETIYNIISLDRLLYGLTAAAYLEPILSDTMAYAQERTAFKAKIADHQYVQGRLTDIKIAMESVRWISYAALDYLVRGDPEASLMGSIAKLQGSEALCLATEHVMQIFGHLGYMEGPIAKDVRDALGTRIAGGTTEMQRRNIMNQMVLSGELRHQVTRQDTAAAWGNEVEGSGHPGAALAR